MRKPTIYIADNKAADQIRGNHEADQPLCFRKPSEQLFPNRQPLS